MTVIASSTFAPSAPVQPAPRDIDIFGLLGTGYEDYFDARDTIVDDIEEPDDFFEDTDPAVIEPTDEIKAAREAREKKIMRFQRSSNKAAVKPRNRELRDLAEQNARNTDNGGEIKKPKLPRCLRKKLDAGDPLNDVQMRKYYLTGRQYHKHVKNLQRVAKAKRNKKIALAIA